MSGFSNVTGRWQRTGPTPLDDWPDDLIPHSIRWLKAARLGPVPFSPRSPGAVAAYVLHDCRMLRIWHRDAGGFELRPWRPEARR